jgi:hypothetical protein
MPSQQALPTNTHTYDKQTPVSTTTTDTLNNEKADEDNTAKPKSAQQAKDPTP